MNRAKHLLGDPWESRWGITWQIWPIGMVLSSPREGGWFLAGFLRDRIWNGRSETRAWTAPSWRSQRPNLSGYIWMVVEFPPKQAVFSCTRKTLKLLLHVYTCVLPVKVWAHVCGRVCICVWVSSEARRGSQISWNCSYKQKCFLKTNIMVGWCLSGVIKHEDLEPMLKKLKQNIVCGTRYPQPQHYRVVILQGGRGPHRPTSLIKTSSRFVETSVSKK